MSESKRISKLFSDLYNGNPWTLVKITDLLDGITADQAAQRPVPGANTIWQLVQHCNGWRDNVLRKLKGETPGSPEDNFISDPTDITEHAWNTLKKQFDKTEKEWELWMNTLEDEILLDGYAPSKNEFTIYEVIHGILHHDNYHFGQIMILKKLVR